MQCKRASTLHCLEAMTFDLESIPDTKDVWAQGGCTWPMLRGHPLLFSVALPILEVAPGILKKSLRIERYLKAQPALFLPLFNKEGFKKFKA